MSAKVCVRSSWSLCKNFHFANKANYFSLIGFSHTHTHKSIRMRYTFTRVVVLWCRLASSRLHASIDPNRTIALKEISLISLDRRAHISLPSCFSLTSNIHLEWTRRERNHTCHSMSNTSHIHISHTLCPDINKFIKLERFASKSIKWRTCFVASG